MTNPKLISKISQIFRFISHIHLTNIRTETGELKVMKGLFFSKIMPFIGGLVVTSCGAIWFLVQHSYQSLSNLFKHFAGGKFNKSTGLNLIATEGNSNPNSKFHPAGAFNGLLKTPGENFTFQPANYPVLDMLSVHNSGSGFLLESGLSSSAWDCMISGRIDQSI